MQEEECRQEVSHQEEFRLHPHRQQEEPVELADLGEPHY